jgi:putative membrane protein
VKLVIWVLVNAVALAVATWLLRGISLTGADETHRALTLLVVALIFGAINAVIRPVLKFVSFPLIILTLGLLIFLINALMLMLTGYVATRLGFGFHVHGFWTALVGGIIIMVATALLHLALPDEERRR